MAFPVTTKDLETLQKRTFYGKEKKSLAYVIAIMNMILHGIAAPNIMRTNTLTENLADIQEKDRYEIVMANPPFGGKERKEVQQNFPIRDPCVFNICGGPGTGTPEAGWTSAPGLRHCRLAGDTSNAMNDGMGSG